MMYLNLHIVGGTATFAESGRSHQSAHVGNWQRAVGPDICFKNYFPQLSASQWKYRNSWWANKNSFWWISPSLPWEVGSMIQNSFLGKRLHLTLWVLFPWWMWRAQVLVSEQSNSENNVAGKLAIATLPAASHARAGRSHKRYVSSGMTLNLKPQHAFPELATVCRTLTFQAVPASHRNLGKMQKQTS